jgi:hypothetical protein
MLGRPQNDPPPAKQSPHDPSPAEALSQETPQPSLIQPSPAAIALNYSSEYTARPVEWVCLAESLTLQQYITLRQALNVRNVPVRQGRVEENSPGSGPTTTGLLVPGELYQLAVDVRTEAGSPGIVPSGPIIPLNYESAPTDADFRWTLIAECATLAEWHTLKAALGRANIAALMKSSGPAHSGDDEDTCDLWVLTENAPLAKTIVEARLRVLDWCPHCGSTFVHYLPAAWYWYVLAVVFLMMPPYWPPSKECGNCRRTWS